MHKGSNSGHLDKNQRREIRVFISSTFLDFVEERNLLATHVFPELRKICAERGVVFNDVDLRWGITQEQAERGEVLPICLREIEKCRPFFIGLLGERYGWVPDDIPKNLLQNHKWLEEHKEKSITELEIIYGVLSSVEMSKCSAFYFRHPEYINTLQENQQKDFRPADKNEQNKLTSLKKKIYSNSYVLKENYNNPHELSELVLKHLKDAIEQKFPENEILNPLDRENFEHECFLISRSRCYIESKSDFERLDAHVVNKGEQGLVVLGESGIGKSALLSNWVIHYRNMHPNTFILTHYIGATPESAEMPAMLRRIMGELKQRFSIDEEIPTKPNELQLHFRQWLSIASARGGMVLVLDALNQLQGNAVPLELGWLPEQLPEGVRLIVSSLPGRSLEVLKAREWPTLMVKPLTKEKRRELVSSYLLHHSKELEMHQVEKIICAEQSINPLFLKVLLDELCVTGCFKNLDKQIEDYLVARDIAELYRMVLERNESSYEEVQPHLVCDAMSCIWAARRGISEPELLAIIKSTQAKWAPLHYAVHNSLISHSGLISFAHDYLRQAVEEKYLSTEESKINAHEALAGYFETKELSDRKVDELPWQLLKASGWKRLTLLLSDLQFLDALFQQGQHVPQSYWAAVEQNSSYTSVKAYQRYLKSSEEDIVDEFYNVAMVLDNGGHLQDAVILFSRLAEHFRQSKRPLFQANALDAAATILAALGQLSKALSWHEKAESIFRSLGSPADSLVVTSESNRALIMMELGRIDEAMILFGKLKVDSKKTKDYDGLQRAIGNQAIILQRRCENQAALELHRECDRICRKHGLLDGLQRSLGNQVDCLITLENTKEVLPLLLEKESICRENGYRSGLRASLERQSIILASKGAIDKAMRKLDEQKKLLNAEEDQLERARGMANRSLALALCGDLKSAKNLCKQAGKIFYKLGNIEGIKSTNKYYEEFIRK